MIEFIFAPKCPPFRSFIVLQNLNIEVKIMYFSMTPKMKVSTALVVKFNCQKNTCHEM